MIEINEDLKKCSKCGNISLKSNFQKGKNRKDGLQPHCVSCMKKYFLDNRYRVKQNYLNNHDRRKIYQKKT